MKNHNEISSFIWNVCDDVLRGLFKQHEYGDVILPFIVLRRMDCVLESHKDDILKVHNEYKSNFEDTSKIIETKLNLKFSNYSRYDLKRLKEEPSKLSENFYDYLTSFSTNVQDIVQNFGLQKHIDKLDSNDKLYLLVEKFTEIDLHPSVVDNYVMGNIFEELIRKFSEMSNETSGEHYTPRDVVKLLVSLVFSSEKEVLKDPNKIISLYDPCCGTGGMLTIGKDWIHQNINSDVDVNLFGQELNPQTYSICKSDFLITDEEPNNIKLGSTLTQDQHNDGNRKFDYMITNPPFGVSWKSEQKQIQNESKEFGGRFSVGTPRTSDGSFLFLQHMISKMEPNGSRIGIIFNQSPLYSGEVNSGENKIRKWLIENDYIEMIIELPDEIFFNTPIQTFIWILNNKKPLIRKNKIQLINGINQFSLLRKKLGNKRKEITPKNRGYILNLYNDMVNNEDSIIFDSKSFKYNHIYLKNKDGEKLSKHFIYEKIPGNEIDNDFFRDSFLEIDSKKMKNNDTTGYEINFKKYFPTTIPNKSYKTLLDELLTLDKDNDF